jgi:RNA polymerase sigma-B factor
VQELVLEAREAARQLTQDLGRAPADSEMARHLRVTSADLREARQAEIACRPSSLDAPMAGQPGTVTLADVLGEEDPRVEHMLGMRAVAAHWGELPLREQKILLMRFADDMTQAQIGQQLGISQMHVSRLSTRALGYLRQRVVGRQERPAGLTRDDAGILHGAEAVAHKDLTTALLARSVDADVLLLTDVHAVQDGWRSAVSPAT